MKSILCLIVPCCLLVAAGCGGTSLPTIDVVGTVTIDGSPVEGAMVFFKPVDPAGMSASATTDASGKYDLTTELNGDGALVGDYKVEISKYEEEVMDAGASEDGEDDDAIEAAYTALDAMGGKEAESTSLIAAKFASSATSGLTAKVAADEGQNVFDFEVTK